MRQFTLSQFATEKGQTKAGIFLGMTQSSINKALQAGRNVLVTEHADGSFTAEELRPFPVQSAKRSRRGCRPSYEPTLSAAAPREN
ncbi:Cro/CI family transcriptional regulator [Pseudomonas sp. R37(2017)]|uniref:Cro/CI family transcriptional regulator n=1 Tax=Pseudomonas sp. R37(2017) TaxID=1981685 RepID=UPI000A1E2CDB